MRTGQAALVVRLSGWSVANADTRRAGLTAIVVGVDTGGTFTDLVLLGPGGLLVHKVPSTPDDPSRSILRGLAELGAWRDGAWSQRDTELVHGTTVATNALLERKGARTALVTTAGFEDLLELARQTRPSLYDFMQQKPPPLAPPELCFGLEERVLADGSVERAPSAEAVRRVVEAARDAGAEAVAISLLFSFLHPAHEELVAEALAELDPPPFISVSNRVLPQYREYERTSTVTANAYVGPVMAGYLRRLEAALGAEGSRPGRVRVMQSSGGSVSLGAAAQEPVRTVLSGPAGGVVGALAVARLAGYPDIITLDMGGTSTDVSLCPGRLQETVAASLGGVPIGVPMLDVHTVGAGGGSIAHVDAGGALTVGPESAGADPGPACYGVGDAPTVTDANLVLGRIRAEDFLGGRMPLDRGAAGAALARLAEAMGADVDAAALGVVRVVNATMERAVRAISLERGFDPREFTLVAFGGAGPQHACELAEGLGITRVLAPTTPGALSAYGVAIADITKDYSQTVLLPQDEVTADRLRQGLAGLRARALAELRDEGVPGRRTRLQPLLDMRYVGQSYELTVDCPRLGARVAASAARAFHAAHAQRFGYADDNAPIEVVNLRLKAVGVSAVEQPGAAPPTVSPKGDPLVAEDTVVFAGGPRQTPFLRREALPADAVVPGPAVVLQMDATTVIPPGWTARVDGYGNLVISHVSR